MNDEQLTVDSGQLTAKTRWTPEQITELAITIRHAVAPDSMLPWGEVRKAYEDGARGAMEWFEPYLVDAKQKSASAPVEPDTWRSKFRRAARVLCKLGSSEREWRDMAIAEQAAAKMFVEERNFACAQVEDLRATLQSTTADMNRYFEELADLRAERDAARAELAACIERAEQAEAERDDLKDETQIILGLRDILELKNGQSITMRCKELAAMKARLDETERQLQAEKQERFAAEDELKAKELAAPRTYTDADVEKLARVIHEGARTGCRSETRSYEDLNRVGLERIKNAARASLDWMGAPVSKGTKAGRPLPSEEVLAQVFWQGFESSRKPGSRVAYGELDPETRRHQEEGIQFVLDALAPHLRPVDETAETLRGRLRQVSVSLDEEKSGRLRAETKVDELEGRLSAERRAAELAMANQKERYEDRLQDLRNNHLGEMTGVQSLLANAERKAWHGTLMVQALSLGMEAAEYKRLSEECWSLMKSGVDGKVLTERGAIVTQLAVEEGATTDGTDSTDGETAVTPVMDGAT